MKTIKITTKEQLDSYKESGEIFNLDMRNWQGGNIYLRGAKTGDIDLIGAKTGGICLKYAKTGDIYLVDAKTGGIFLEDAKYKKIIQNYTEADKQLLRELPMKSFYMDNWQSNNNWKKCKSIEQLHTCGTTFCIRGYAEAKYFVENGKEVEDKDSLYPNLKHLYYMTTEQAKKEITKILEQ